MWLRPRSSIRDAIAPLLCGDLRTCPNPRNRRCNWRFLGISRCYGWGRGVAATLVGRIDRTTSGCRPVSDLRNAVTLSISASFKFWPSWDSPITATYVDAFKKAFPAEATLITPDAPFDRWLKGDDKALTEEQKEGLKIFVDKGCSTCHNGVNVGGGMYAPFGVIQRPGWEFLPPDDRGRFAVTKTVGDDYVFKVPTLRNIELTAPYFHSGHAWDLKQAQGRRRLRNRVKKSLDLIAQRIGRDWGTDHEKCKETARSTADAFS
jgi:hypothetical protein